MNTDPFTGHLGLFMDTPFNSDISNKYYEQHRKEWFVRGGGRKRVRDAAPAPPPANRPQRAALEEQRTSGRRRKGQCVYCGYGPRESPERCPECGTA